MPAAFVLQVLRDAEGREQALHEPPKVRFPRMQIEVHVIPHQRVCMHLNVIQSATVGKLFEKHLIVRVIEKHSAAIIATIHDVVPHPRGFYSQRSGHPHNIP
jgi:hypothetical protein